MELTSFGAIFATKVCLHEQLMLSVPCCFSVCLMPFVENIVKLKVFMIVASLSVLQLIDNIFPDWNAIEPF